MKRYTELEAAQLVLSYYRVVDSDEMGDDYYQRSSAILSVCLEAFSEYSYAEDNIIATLFLICCNLDESLMALDSMGAEEASRLTQEGFNKADANLRHLVSLLTGEELAMPVPPEQDFANHFVPTGNVVRIFPRRN